jgi:hypothetical protein
MHFLHKKVKKALDYKKKVKRISAIFHRFAVLWRYKKRNPSHNEKRYRLLLQGFMPKMAIYRRGVDCYFFCFLPLYSLEIIMVDVTSTFGTVLMLSETKSSSFAKSLVASTAITSYSPKTIFACITSSNSTSF